MDFIATEMGYHAKALEILTDAYNEIQNVDEEKDLHVSLSGYLSLLKYTRFIRKIFNK